MTSYQPKLRSDLELRVQVSSQGRVVVVKDPANGEFYRLQEAEQFIAQQLDGETLLETVRSRAEQKFGAPLEPEALTGFIKTLDRNGLLETDDGAPNRRSKRRRLNGSLLNLRFRLYDPERLLNWLIHRAGFFFTPWFVLMSACLIGAAAMMTVSNWNEIVRDAAPLYSLATLPLLIATMFILVAAHEFAHGLTCRHFGGAVREMGFFLIYFQPAFYCNVSDAWLFPKKSQRLWVGIAGPYFELFLWALATMAWRVTDTATWINQISLVVMAVSGIKTLVNFNPLIKLDGYYLLSDWLEIPNLRKKSFRYLGEFLTSLAGWARPLPEVSRRERRIFLTYGLTAWVASVSLLGYISLMVGEFLLAEHQRMAFLTFAGVVGFRLRDRFRKLFRRDSEDSGIGAAAPPVAPTDSPDSAAAEAGPVRDKDSPRKAKRRRARLHRLILKLAGVAALLLLLYLGRTELRVAGTINVLPHHNADVRTEIDGIIEEIAVDEGQAVSKGDLIARLFDRDVRAELQKTGAALEEAQAKLRLLVAGPRPEEIEQGRIEVAKSAEAVKFATSRLDRDASLFEEKLVSKQELEDSEANLAQRTSESATAKSKLDVLLAGSRPEEIEAMKASIASLETQRLHLDEQLRLMRVVSPASGTVATPARQLIEMKLRFVEKGELIAKVYDFHTITAEIVVSEKEIADVRTGQTVALKVRAYPNQVFEGRVTEIATTAQGAADSSANASSKAGFSASPSGNSGRYVSTILVTTEIDNSDGLLKPGMTGMAKIDCGKHRIIDLVTRRLSRTFKVEFWSWW